MEPLLHFTIPFAILIIIGVNPKKAFLLSLLGPLPDVDAVMLTHRSLTHSVVVLGLLFVPVFIYLYSRARHYVPWAILGFLVFATHGVFDIFSSYTPVLWPILSQSIFIRLRMNFQYTAGYSVVPDIRVQGSPTDFEQLSRFSYPIFTGEGFVLTLVILGSVLVKMAYERRLFNRFPWLNRDKKVENPN